MTPWKRKEIIGDCTLYLGDSAVIAPYVEEIGAVVSDPPYPNSAGHFLDGIAAAQQVAKSVRSPHWLYFWTEVEAPPVPLPLVAVHIWHRTNTNRPDNYEPIFEFHEDAKKRASRVLPYCVIFPGMTGIEASGHPTEKNVSLMIDLVKRTQGLVLDPFMGSGTTGVACTRLGRPFVGVEINESFFEISCRRIRKAYAQPDMFVQKRAPEPKQEAMF